MKVELHDDRTFSSAAAMRAHYAAVRARLHPQAPRPAPEPEPAARCRPRIPLPLLEQRLAEERRRDLIRQAQFDLNDGTAIVKYAAAYFGVTLDEVRQKGRQGGPSLDARHVAAHVMLRWFGRGRKNYNNQHSLKWIAGHIHRDHTIVLYADARVRRSNKLLKASDVVLQQLQDRSGPYVAIESFQRVDPEAYTRKRTVISACGV
jgi:hypothetical protein